MKTRNVPDPKTALADLAGFTPPLFEVLEGALLEARGFFRAREERVNIWTYCDLVRYHGLLLFKAHGFKPAELPNNGLSITYGHYRIKIYKRLRDKVPPPGPSRTRQRFYKENATPYVACPRQLPLLGSRLMAFLTRIPGDPINLIVTWEPTKDFDLAGVWLALPKNGTHNPAGVELFWEQPILHPAISLRPDEAAFGQEEETDLDITMREDDDTATGTEPEDD